VVLVAVAVAGCAGPEHGCVPTMAGLKVGMTKADAINAWCYPSTATKTESAIPVFDPASRTLKTGTQVHEIWFYSAGPFTGSSLVFDESGRLVSVTEAHH